MKLLLAIAALLVLAAVACTKDDAERIRQANSAAATESAKAISTPFDPEQLVGTISVFDLRDGDCFNLEGPSPAFLDTLEGEETTEVLFVPCSGDWEHRVVNSFVVDRDGDLPAIDYFDEIAFAECHRLYDWYLGPTAESWDVGDRTIACIQDNPTAP
jgi:hypothetical protein